MTHCIGLAGPSLQRRGPQQRPGSPQCYGEVGEVSVHRLTEWGELLSYGSWTVPSWGWVLSRNWSTLSETIGARFTLWAGSHDYRYNQESWHIQWVLTTSRHGDDYPTQYPPLSIGEPVQSTPDLAPAVVVGSGHSVQALLGEPGPVVVAVHHLPHPPGVVAAFVQLLSLCR